MAGIDARVRIGDSDDYLEGVSVTTPAGVDLFREGVVVSDPELAHARQRVTDEQPAPDDFGAVVRVAGGVDTGLVQPTTPADLQPIQDAAERFTLSVATSVTAIGDTVIYTPAAGKRIRLKWIYAINDPVAETSTKITIKLGAQAHYVAWAISKRQMFDGPVDGALIINLTNAGDVAVTAFIEEID